MCRHAGNVWMHLNKIMRAPLLPKLQHPPPQNRHLAQPHIPPKNHLPPTTETDALPKTIASLLDQACKVWTEESRFRLAAKQEDTSLGCTDDFFSWGLLLMS